MQRTSISTFVVFQFANIVPVINTFVSGSKSIGPMMDPPGNPVKSEIKQGRVFSQSTECDLAIVN